ncbi:MAG: terminase large subunit domain-containing protein [Nanoarchaeota archaeon]
MNQQNKIELSKIQMKGMKILSDSVHTEIFYGGSAGGGKSFIGCLWLLTSALRYEGSRWFMARARLKSLKESTLLTFFEVCKICKVLPNTHYNYNAISGVIKFVNGSEIYLRDLFKYPSDPDFVSLGSTEYCGGFIDEMGEITEQAYNIIKSRLRFKLEQFNIIPKLLMGSNPCKTFVYREFYSKWKNNELEDYKAYVPASVYENPFISHHYIENLKKLDKTNRERLLEGNWEYDDDPSILIEYDAILDMFNSDYKNTGEFYISCDVARFGKDRAIIMFWDGLYLKKVWDFGKCTTKELRLKIESISQQYYVPRSNIVIDSDGVGGGLVDEMEGVKGFVNGSSAIINDFEKAEKNRNEYHMNYANLKTQCAFILAEKINQRKITITKDIDKDLKTDLIEELEQLKRKDIDKDQMKVRLVQKNEVKENIGRSPDLADSMIMRMLFEIDRQTEVFIFSAST